MNGQLSGVSVKSTQIVFEKIHESVVARDVNTNLDSLPENNEKDNQDESSLSNVQKVYTSLVAGATAGALAKTVIAPLDRTKINFQISKSPYSQKAAINFLLESYNKDGLMSLWRGNSATMVRIVPYSAIQFASHEQWKQLLGINDQKTSSWKGLLAGSLAGVTSQSMTYPLDLARARMAVTQKAEYSTLRSVFYQIYKYEGLSAFYRGFFATILGVVPYAGCSFFTYDFLKNLLKGMKMGMKNTRQTLFA